MLQGCTFVLSLVHTVLSPLTWSKSTGAISAQPRTVRVACSNPSKKFILGAKSDRPVFFVKAMCICFSIAGSHFQRRAVQ